MPRRVSALAALAMLTWLLLVVTSGGMPSMGRAFLAGLLLAAGVARVAHVPEPGGQPWFTVLQK